MRLLQGDCLEVLKQLEENSVDSIVTDPPYGLSFMGKKWDYDVPSKEVWQECLRVLKPGGYLLSFAGTRTQHRMAVNIEDAGFEIRDMIAWVYGSGFPKSLNIADQIAKREGAKREGAKREGAKREGAGTSGNTFPLKQEYLEYTKTENSVEWEGWGTALKPALEPITVARKPLSEKTVAENVLKWGTGGINIDGSRVPHQSEADRESATPQGKVTSNTSAGAAPDVDMSEVDYNGEKYWYKNEYKWLIDKWLNDEDYVWSELKNNLETYEWCKVPEIDDGDRVLFDSGESVCIRLYESKRKEFDRPDTSLGRFPANLIHDGSDEVVGLFPDSGNGKFSSGSVRTSKESIYELGFKKKDEQVAEAPDNYGDSGSAARFFYCAKASKADRDEGLEEFEEKEVRGGGGRVEQGYDLSDESQIGLKEAARKYGAVKQAKRNTHPTVKPTKLMQYLVKLVTPKGGVVLDPFMGSGSTGKACKLEGFDFIGIEREEEYVKIAKARIKSVAQGVLL